MIDKTSNQTGFSLIEILITVAIMTIITSIAIPVYTQHLVHAKRLEAEISLSKLAAALEQYAIANNTYKNANGETLKISPLKNYQLEIASATDTQFSLNAFPLGAQAKNDEKCATLTLNSNGEKGITGSGTIEECW